MADLVLSKAELAATEVEDEEEDLGPPQVAVCHGPPRCTEPKEGGCEYCYRFWGDDERSTDQIFKDMEKVQ